jgi:hypothetical protein
MTTFKSRKMTAFALFLGLFCLMRAVQASAVERDFDEPGTDDEVYEGRSNDADESGPKWGSRSIASDADGPRHEVRFTRPEEHSARKLAVYGEDEFEQIEGAEYLRTGKASAARTPASAIAVPSAPSTFKPAAELKAESAVARITPDAAETQAWAAARREQTAPSASVERNPIPVRESYDATPEARIPVAVNGAGAVGINADEARMSAARARGVQEVSIIASEHGFFPERVFVTQGIPVRMFLSTAGRGTSCFMVDAFGVRKGINPGNVEEVRFLPEKSGEFRFYCPVGAIEGKMTVRAPASAISAD